MAITTSFSDPRNHPDNANIPNINRPETIMGTTISFLSLAIIAMSLRLWVRVRDGLWGWDDAFVLFAGIASIVGDSMVCLMPGDGLGLHLWTLGSGRLESYFRHIYTTNMSYCASAAFIKLAILLQYLRLFAETATSTSSAQYRLARRITFFLITLSSLWGLAFFLLAVFPCNPIAKDWNTSLEGTCVGWGSKNPTHFYAMFAGHSASNMVLDMLVLLMPIPFLGMLRIGGKSKAGLITLFALGCIVCAVSVGRLISIIVTHAGTYPILDMPYYTPTIYIFSVLEVNLAIVAASIPIFWPMIATLATNKIWVVNEIEIRVENTSRGTSATSGEIDLAERGSWTKLDSKEDFVGQTRRLSVTTKTYDRTDPHIHRHKQSNTSSIGRQFGIEAGPRSSNESQRKLCRIPSVEAPGDRKGSLARSEREDWFAEVGRQNSAAATKTTIVTAEVPLEEIKKREK